MASIQKRTTKDGSISYRIRVLVGKVGEKQIMRSTIWHVPDGMTSAKAEKEAHRQAALFEEKLKTGMALYDGNTTFGEYAEQWVKNHQCAGKTKDGYQELMKRIQPALGHIRLSKLQPHHLEAFYQNLAEKGINQRGNYAIFEKLPLLLKAKHLTYDKLAAASNISSFTVSTAVHGKHVSFQTAQKISKALKKPVEAVFTLHKNENPLSANCIMHYHRLISAILSKAEQEQLVVRNVARLAEKPRVIHKEAVYLDDEQAKQFLSFVLEEPDIRIKSALLLLLFTGMRREELCGLSWSDLDESSQLVHIYRSSQYRPHMGELEGPTKNPSSVRAIKIPLFVVQTLKEYHAWWTSQQIAFGKEWQGKLQRLFIQENGSPINPDTINYWLEKFLRKHNFPHITPHSLRHTFATLNISNGVDIRTLQSLTGHAQASTLVNTYSHAIKSRQAAACDALEEVLTGNLAAEKQA